ncbi:MAG: OmpA family protein [Bacteroidales bacterium]|nr:OmpA family protein [Bacteroidales bacterium]
MKRIILASIALLVACASASAQLNALKKYGEKLKNSVENKVTNRVESEVDQSVDNAVDKTLDKIFNKKQKDTAEGQQPAANAGWKCPECGHAGNSGNFCGECGAKKPGAAERTAGNAAGRADAQTRKAVQTAYAKTDFVPGDEIFFEDDFARERLGEFPLRWELLDGYVETASLEGRKVLAFTDNGMGQVLPNMKDKWAWLPEDFTVEYDLFIAPLSDDDPSILQIELCFGAARQSDWYNASSVVTLYFREDGSSSMIWSLKKPGSDSQTRGNKSLGLSAAFEDYSPASPLKAGEWNHLAFSFNKRAFKGYINGVRIINVPSMEAPGYLYFNSAAAYNYSGISNVRIAKGAVPLYDRLLSDGKIVTYAITFETGKADLKPESLVEINRVAKLMQEYPDLEFEVQGHCDNTGSDKVNDPLSQQRAEAIVAALADLGISESRLTPVGKGSHEPVASNKTDEGRSKNRRVEFVKK